MDFASARRRMIDSQVRPIPVDDPAVLAAMVDVPREIFVPKPLAGIAYIDDDIPLGGGRHVMRPAVLAQLLQEAALRRGDVALMVGCGTGYAVAILSRLVSTVVAVERDPGLVERASRIMTEMRIDNVVVVEGDPTQGLPSQAPFDAVFFDGAIAEIPGPIVEQLGEGGRLVAVVRNRIPGSGRGVVVLRTGAGTGRRDVFDATLAFLPGFEPREAFTF